jgi:hypothetical protein
MSNPVEWAIDIIMTVWGKLDDMILYIIRRFIK